jgi:hypothetical protein
LINSQDFQNQMLTMPNATFSKLATIVSDAKTNETKSDWPKFNGDTKKFKQRYLAIVAQLSLAPWKEFYDFNTDTVVKASSNTSLNEKLYAKLRLCLEGQVFQDMVSRKHLRANGILLLTELSQTYRPSHVPEVTAAKTVEFWSTLKRLPYKSVDTYYNQFQTLLDNLEEAGERIHVRSAIHQFIFTLGPDFAPIQNNYRIGLLPDTWKTTDWPTLLILCRDYSNLVHPQGHKHDNSDFANNPSLDRPAHHKKIKQWFMNPVKFHAKLEAEQAKYMGKCIYHLTKSNPTCDCYIKKECKKLLAARKTNNSNATSPSTSTGQLQNLKEAEIEDIVENEVDEVLPEDSNDTNEIDLYYFARIKNHYLCLIKLSEPVSMISRHHMKFPIADSGANHHMFKEKEFFTSITFMKGQVVLGDGKTRLNIHGIGTVRCMVDGHSLLIDNVRYVPDLAESIYSLFLHIKQPDHGLKSSFEEGLQINFPCFTTKAIVGNDDIYLNLDNQADSFPISDTINREPTVCQHIKTTSDKIKSHSGSGDNLLRDLRHYYCTVKTKRQLNMNVPVGFRQSSQLQKDFYQFHPPKYNCPLPPTLSTFSHLSIINESTEHNGNVGDTTLNGHSKIVGDTTLDLASEPSPATNSSSTKNTPIL